MINSFNLTLKFNLPKQICLFLLIFNSIFSDCLFRMWNLQLNYKLKIWFKLENKAYEWFTKPSLIYYWIFLYLNLFLFIFYLFSLLKKIHQKYLHFLLLYFLVLLTFIAANIICFCCRFPVEMTAWSVLQLITLRVHL